MDGHGTTRLDRRALLAVGAMGVAAVAAEAIMPAQAQATNGDAVKVGELNTGTATTVLQTTGATALESASNVAFGLVGRTDGDSAGVWGRCFDGRGIGVHGVNEVTKAEGSLGAQSTGLRGSAPTDLNHSGLFVDGRVTFKRSGQVTIAKNKRSLSVMVPALSATSMVLATLQTNRAGVYIQAAVPMPTLGKITIYLNNKVTAATKVAYFILD